MESWARPEEKEGVRNYRIGNGSRWGQRGGTFRFDNSRSHLVSGLVLSSEFRFVSFLFRFFLSRRFQRSHFQAL